MSRYNNFYPHVLKYYHCPYCHHHLNMLPKKVAMYPPEDDLVSLSTVYDLLDEQQHFYKELIQQQERNYRAFLQMVMDSTSCRMDGLVREMQDLRNLQQRTKSDLADVKRQGVQNSKRSECLADGLVMVRGALDGLSLKVGIPASGAGLRAAETKHRPGLRLDARGQAAAGRAELKKTEPKAVKLVADLTDIHFENIKVLC